jgi:hypothetical protein
MQQLITFLLNATEEEVLEYTKLVQSVIYAENKNKPLISKIENLLKKYEYSSRSIKTST